MRAAGALTMVLAIASSALAGPRGSGQARVTVVIPRVVAASALDPVAPVAQGASLATAAATAIDLQGVAPFQVYAALAVAADRAPDGVVTLGGPAGARVSLSDLAAGPRPLARGLRSAHLEVRAAPAGRAPVELLVTTIADF